MDADGQPWQRPRWLGIWRGTPFAPHGPTRRTPLVCLANPQPRCARINAFLAVSNQRDHLALRLGVTLGQRWASRRVSGGSRGDPRWLNFVS